MEICLLCSYGLLRQPQTVRTAMKRFNLTISICALLGFLNKSCFSQSPNHKTFPSRFDFQAKDRRSGKTPFFGTWADYFSSVLTINVDGSFIYTRGAQNNPTFISGKWKRNQDTFYFIRSNVVDSIKSLDSIQAIWPADLPARLCYFRNKLYHIKPDGKLMSKKVFSPFAIRKNVGFKTLYYRDKKHNRDYFDSIYYYHAMARRFTVGTGIKIMLTAVSEKSTVVSLGFTFSPRYIFNRKPNAYLSLGLPFTIGFSPVNIQTENTPDDYGPHLGILLDLPLVLNYNHEWGSVLTGGSRFGYFTGAGAAYHLNDYSVAKGTVTTIDHINGFGPVINAGIRYSFTKYRVTNLELKFSYLKMIVSSRPNIYGISLIINR
jgi:hypothetical protein